MSVYPDNTMSSYTIKLDPPIDLQGSYEVGLCEISYPRSWLNVKKGEMWLKVGRFPTDDGTLAEVEEKTAMKQKAVTLPPGHYDSVSHLISVLNHDTPKDLRPKRPPPIPMPKAHWKNMFFYRKEVGKVLITLDSDVVLQMSAPLAAVLGFDYQFYHGGIHGYADHVAGVNRNMNSLYVYLSIVEDRVVGDTRAPLLRMVPLAGSRGDVVFQTYHDVHYLPLKFNSFDRVTVNIRNGVGDLIPFERGEVILTVQLRRRGLF